MQLLKNCSQQLLKIVTDQFYRSILWGCTAVRPHLDYLSWTVSIEGMELASTKLVQLIDL